jgi:hypothetical protein
MAICVIFVKPLLPVSTVGKNSVRLLGPQYPRFVLVYCPNTVSFTCPSTLNETLLLQSEHHTQRFLFFCVISEDNIKMGLGEIGLTGLGLFTIETSGGFFSKW